MQSINRLFILGLFFLLSLHALAQNVWSHPESKVQLLPPAGWTSLTPTDNEDIATWESPDQAAQISLSVSEARGLGASSLDEFVRLMITDPTDSARLLGQERVVLGDVEAKIVVLESSLMEARIISHTTVVLANERVYLLIGTCESEQYKIHKSIFDQTSKSLKL